MTQYFCRSCNTKMQVTDEDISTFKRVVKCPKCGKEIIADYREDLG